MMNNQDRTCPDCGFQLSFSGDGSALVCDRCGHRRDLGRVAERPTLADFRQTQRLGHRLNTSNVRGMLRHGIAAAKAEDWREAAKYLETVLLSKPDADDEMDAWLWLSTVYEDPADKRECLEEVLAINPAHGRARRDLAMLDGRLAQEAVINPDQFQQERGGMLQETTAVRMECPRCASRMNFTPDRTALHCDFCHYHEELDAPLPADTDAQDTPSEAMNMNISFGEGAFEQDFTATIHTAQGHAQPVSVRVLQCQNCGISYVLNPKTLSLTCAYCSSVYVTEAAETAELLEPHALIPFAFDREAAKKKYRAWFQQHNFHKLKGVRVSRVVGMYAPVWTFDLSGDLSWSGLIRKQQSGWQSSRDEWEPINGQKYLFFDDYLVSASRQPTPMMNDVLANYTLAELVAYDQRYLADWPAERYMLKLSDAALKARTAVVENLRRNPQRIVSNAYEIRNLRVGTQNLIIESYKLLLLPLWIVHYQHEGETYDVFLNGQTGEIFGEKQESWLGKITSLFKR